MNNHKNDLAHWYPLLQQTGVQTPRTTILRHDLELAAMLDGMRPRGLSQLLQQLTELARQPTLGGYPIFLRTGQTSAKHSWKDSCFVARPEDFEGCLYQLVEFSACCDFFGLPTDTLVLREMLPTEPAFHAFPGRMPITREFRFFFNERGASGHWQPYWPPGAIRYPSCADWREKLAALSALTDKEVGELERLTERVAGAFPGEAWCVDWLWTARGWYATDMALASDAFRWSPDDPPVAEKEERGDKVRLVYDPQHDLGGEG